MVALLMVMLITRQKFHPSIVAAIVPLFLMFIFCMGIGLFLSAAAIYFRDVMHFWTVIVMALNYATPIFYPESIWNGTFMAVAGKLNPLYWYVSTFRGCIIDGLFPSTLQIALCAIFAVISLVVGSVMFRKTQDNFILYI